MQSPVFLSVSFPQCDIIYQNQEVGTLAQCPLFVHTCLLPNRERQTRGQFLAHDALHSIWERGRARVTRLSAGVQAKRQPRAHVGTGTETGLGAICQCVVTGVIFQGRVQRDCLFCAFLALPWGIPDRQWMGSSLKASP